MKIPNSFNKILQNDERLHSCILQIVSDFQPILRDNKLYFFEEYTDHGIEHIESVLNAAAEIITEDSYSLLSAKDIAVLIMSIILHDLGMHIEYSTFLAFLNGEYDDVRIDSLDKKTWKQLWEEYLNEAKRFSSKQRYLYFGNENQPFKEPNLSNKDSLDGADKKLIGEFVRRFHTRFAHEVALKGLAGKDGQIIEFGGSRLDKIYKQLAGMVARSHGMNLRNTFPYLREISGEAWKNPNDINITFLMVVLRIADYFQFDNLRVDKMLLKLKTFKSPVSKTEHDKHLAIDYVQTHFDDVERLYVRAEPRNSNIFVKLVDLIKDIQHELDMSWAVLGEIYGRSPSNKQPKIKYRRITSNLEDEEFLNNLTFVPEKISFQADVELPKLLISPLYGNNPSFGVRELIQNAVDACLEREFEEKRNGNNYSPKIQLEIRKIDDDNYEFFIEDNGKGMTLYEIKNYFLRVGSSFRTSLDWKKKFINDEGSSLITRNGRFGIGVLAAFILGDVIEVKTKHFKEEFGFTFNTSIDTEQIEIENDKVNKSNGTRIKIKISKVIAESLNKIENYSKIPKWTGWFLLNSIDIAYTYLGKPVKDLDFVDVNSNDWHIINPPNFEKVGWKYLTKKYWNSLDSQKVICNGILIPNFSNLFTKYKENTKQVIGETPTLLITDKEGLLPLTLDRNKLGNELPFIDDLAIDLSKDFIASILSLKINPNENFRKMENLSPNTAEVAFLKKGFVFQIDYFFKVLNEKNYNFIRFVAANREIPFSSDYLEIQDVLIPVIDDEIKLSYTERLIRPTYGGRIILNKSKYDLLFDKSKNRISKGLINQHKVEFSDKNTVIFTIDFDKPKSKSFEKFVNIIVGSTESIQEINFNETTSEAGNILTHELEKYLGENVVIPYDFEERKKLYQLAFEELKDYMKKYQNEG